MFEHSKIRILSQNSPLREEGTACGEVCEAAFPAVFLSIPFSLLPFPCIRCFPWLKSPSCSESAAQDSNFFDECTSKPATGRNAYVTLDSTGRNAYATLGQECLCHSFSVRSPTPHFKSRRIFIFQNTSFSIGRFPPFSRKIEPLDNPNGRSNSDRIRGDISTNNRICTAHRVSPDPN